MLAVLAAWTALSATAHSQVLPADKVPPNVRHAVESKFPGVGKVEWKLKSDKNYEAEFSLKDADVAAKFDAAGTWVETESSIERSALPRAVLATIAQDYKCYKIIETQRVERAGGKPVLFEVHLGNRQEILKVQFEG